MRDTGIAIITAEEERQPRRKKYSTSPVVTSPSSNVWNVLRREFLMKDAWL